MLIVEFEKNPKIVEFENMQFSSFRGQLLSFKSRDELTLGNTETLESAVQEEKYLIVI
mgnify:CR=1 FL=1